MGRWDALKPEAAETADSFAAASHRERRAQSRSARAPTAARGTGYSGNTHGKQLSHRTRRKSFPNERKGCGDRNGRLSDEKFNRSLRVLDQKVYELRRAQRKGEQGRNVVDGSASDQVQASLRQAINDFSVDLFTEVGGNDSATWASKDSVTTTDGFLTIAAGAKGRAVALLFQLIDLLDSVESGKMNDTVSLTCDFVSSLIHSCEQCHGQRENRLIEMSDNDVGLSIKVVSCRLSLVMDWSESRKYEVGLPLLRCLRRVLGYFGAQAKAEETAESVVNSILLPILEMPDHRACSKPRESLEVCIVASDCVSLLMQRKHHASAILAPLVVNVSDTGEENYMINPLRSRIMDSMHNLILYGDDHAILSHACICLTNVLDAVASIEQKNKQGKCATADIDVISLLKRTHYLIEHYRVSKYEKGSEGAALCRCALGLLASLTKVYSRVTASQWALFLQERFQSVCQDQSLLLSIISHKDSISKELDAERVAALRAAKELIASLPLQLWFAPSKGHRANQSGNLVSQVRGALAHIMKSISSLMKHWDTESSAFVVGLADLSATMIAAVVPFEFDEFIRPASTILSLTGDILLEQMGTTGFNSELSSAASNVIAISVGGKLDPQGKLTPLLAPARDWLCSPESDRFILSVLSFFVSKVSYQCQSRVQALQNASSVLSTIFRMAPFCASKNEKLVKCFDDAMQRAAKSDDARLRASSAEVLESFLHGRKDFFSQIAEKERDSSLVSCSLCPLLFRMLSDPDTSVQCHALAGCGFLRGSEWDEILCECNMDTFVIILSLSSSTGKGTTGTVRAAACKSIGQICTTCITNTNEKASEAGVFATLPLVCAEIICEKVSCTMLAAIRDHDASVRSMALFAVGNLALALSERGSTGAISADQMLELCVSVQSCLVDRNEKVVGNAIRTIGHIANILFHDLSNILPQTEASHIYNEVTATLCCKIEAAIRDALLVSPQRTWKQRSCAKKNAKGAANAMLFFLTSQTAMEKSSRAHAQRSLQSLIRCVENAGVVDERVTLAAISTLVSTSMDLWHQFGGENNSVAHMLSVLMLVMFQPLQANEGRHKCSISVQDKVCALMRRVLSFSRSQDICECLANENVTPCMVDRLYMWMVNEDVDNCMLKAVAHALQSKQLRRKFDVATTQKFISRAAYEHKRAMSKEYHDREGTVFEGFDEL